MVTDDAEGIDPASIQIQFDGALRRSAGVFLFDGLQHLAVMLHCRVVLTQPLEQFGQPGANDVIIGTRHG